ncbi:MULTISPECIES: chromosomal replication initiator protein DnaA [Limibacillus]|jgi:chromosomal replication initiator protein|uniref:Chromosomal replication initiator protein DnaA n=1 Tax=Limibacillus halophilus TaxID=1579333 RepID=A0A839SWC9_9PROT|nr:chromosomal replication initiator protein DnaA [Limibacillus halophilus]MBB3065265.1 chromosomal replication initiator protein [Limibacillus halophilus]
MGNSASERDVSEAWAKVRGRLRDEVGEAAFRSWLKPLTLVGLNNGQVRLAVPTRFMRDWVISNYSDRLRALWASEDGALKGVEIVVRSSPTRAPLVGAGKAFNEEPADDDADALAQGNITPVAEAKRDGYDDISAPLDPRSTFESFVVGQPNELAYAAARRVAEAGSVAFNPLFLYGGVGLGKTHLMHSIAWHVRQRSPQKKVIYLSAEKFMYQFIRALRTKDTVAFKDQFRSVDVLMIDDVQFIGGRESTQEEFFHTFNALVDQSRQVVVSADKSPSNLEGVEERMRSRLGWGLVAEIDSTNYELRLGILQSKAEQMKCNVSLKVLEFLAHKITSNVRELEGALNRITAHATLVGRPVTLETAQEVLHDLLHANARRLTIEEIQRKVAQHFNIRHADMLSARRARAVARPRQVAMYLSKQLTSRSLPEIGRRFGGRDHTTVMHAVRKIDELRGLDAGFADEVDLLRRMLEN